MEDGKVIEVGKHDATVPAPSSRARGDSLDTRTELGRARDAQRERLRNLSPARKFLGLVILCCWAFGFSLGMFYIVTNLEEQSTHVIDVLISTAQKTYIGLAESYQSITNPATPTEVAELMTEFYELLAGMGYYDASIIARPPHTDPGINKTLAVKLGFSQAAIDMMDLLPYLNTTEYAGQFSWSHGEDNEFLLHGVFANMRDDGHLETSRDPFYMVDTTGDIKGWDEDGGPYMRSDFVALSLPGSEGSMMVLNVANMKMWTVDTEFGNTDPALRDPETTDYSGNWISLEKHPSRLGRDALRDYIAKFRTLEWIPGGLYNGSWAGDEYARMYRENGWETSFNLQAFNIARIAWEASDSKRYEEEEPFRKVQRLEVDLTETLNFIQRTQKEIKDLDAGKEIKLPNHPDRRLYQQELAGKVQESIETLPVIQKNLEVAREALKEVDSELKKAREERVSKYGY